MGIQKKKKKPFTGFHLLIKGLDNLKVEPPAGTKGEAVNVMVVVMAHR